MKFGLMFFLLLTISCKNSTLPTSQTTLPFDGHPFSVNNFSGTPSGLRKKLLHEIYLKKKVIQQLESEKVTDEDLEDIRFDSNYNKNFKKLIISYPNSEELFYIPNRFTKDEIFLALGMVSRKNKFWVWKDELQVGETAYLIEVSPAEVLINEQNFAKVKLSTLNEIYPFQEIAISLKVFEATPQFKTIRDRASSNSDRETTYTCNFERTVPSGTYSTFLPLNLETLGSKIIFNNNIIQSLIFHSESGILTARISNNSSRIDRISPKIEFDTSPVYQFVSAPETCDSELSAIVFNLQNKREYQTEYEVFGVTETLDSFGILPSKI
jgi:hypothetical protein